MRIGGCWSFCHCVHEALACRKGLHDYRYAQCLEGADQIELDKWPGCDTCGLTTKSHRLRKLIDHEPEVASQWALERSDDREGNGRPFSCQDFPGSVTDARRGRAKSLRKNRGKGGSSWARSALFTSGHKPIQMLDLPLWSRSGPSWPNGRSRVAGARRFRS